MYDIRFSPSLFVSIDLMTRYVSVQTEFGSDNIGELMIEWGYSSPPGLAFETITLYLSTLLSRKNGSIVL